VYHVDVRGEIFYFEINLTSFKMFLRQMNVEITTLELGKHLRYAGNGVVEIRRNLHYHVEDDEKSQ
jgi:hypothetical protein